MSSVIHVSVIHVFTFRRFSIASMCLVLVFGFGFYGWGVILGYLLDNMVNKSYSNCVETRQVVLPAVFRDLSTHILIVPQKFFIARVDKIHAKVSYVQIAHNNKQF